MSDLSAALAALANKENQPVSVASEPQTVEQLRILTERVELLEASGKPSKAHSTKPTPAPTAATVEHLEAGDDTPAPQPEGLTARELSIRLGLNRSAVSNWWTGRKNPTPEQFTEWSRKQNDPDGQAWRRGTDDKYYPLSQIVPDSPG